MRRLRSLRGGFGAARRLRPSSEAWKQNREHYQPDSICFFLRFPLDGFAAPKRGIAKFQASLRTNPGSAQAREAVGFAIAKTI